MDDSESGSGTVREALLPRVGGWVDGRYQLVRCIGEGGMGAVFEARHKFMDTAYALKFLQEELAAQPKLATRFLREARIAGRIDNPHVVKVFDVNCEEGGLPYMVMELLQGETLHARCRRRSRDPLGALEIHELIGQILDGVAAAHRLGVVHRDLKPANVMLTRDDVGRRMAKVLDFGLAKLLEDGASGGVTEPGTVLGTPDYMPPEQAFGQGVDLRADVFALGVIFFELIAGRRPVDGEAPAEIAAAYQHGRAKRLDDLVPSVDATLAAAIQKAIQPKPEDRFDSVVEFQTAFLNVSAPDPNNALAAPAVQPSSHDPAPTEPDSIMSVPVPWPTDGEREPTPRIASRGLVALIVGGAIVAALIVWALLTL